MCHAKYYALLEKKRFLAPIGDNPQKILDLGCGTGKSTAAGGYGSRSQHAPRYLVHRRGRYVPVC